MVSLFLFMTKLFKFLDYVQILYLRQLVTRMSDSKTTSGLVRSWATSAIAGKIAK